MNDNEKILMLLEVLVSEVKEMNSKFEAKFDKLETRMDKLEAKMDNFEARMDNFEAKMDNFETKMDNFETRMDKLDTRMDAAEKQAVRNVNFLIDEIERSDKRILSYIENMALNEAGEQAKARLGLV